MMEKIVLKAKNREELDNMVKRSLTLGEDEEFRITVLKEPKKILFFNVNGDYEIEIVKIQEITIKKIEKMTEKIQRKM